MSKLRFRISVSLDGYVAGPNQSRQEPLGVGGEGLHEWVVALEAWRRAHGKEGGEVNDVISYNVVASDSADFIDSTAATTYKVVALLNEWYAADTGAACTVHDISATGAPIDTSAPPGAV